MSGDTWQVRIQLSECGGVLFANAVLEEGPVPVTATSRVLMQEDEPSLSDCALAARRALTELAASLRRYEVPVARAEQGSYADRRETRLAPGRTAIA